ncbi:hypothetical protein X769_15655 [Mesorhizobium sp. LSJC268A00]|uniref:hypothetical protein n=1 Tax=unclassified Mesorhizobium TaxID=325217 RepID=UPI0003CE60E9|nr:MULTISPECIES: hypothetical protein [unclassified Mesorhizobium]ESX03910.1 hypothetical protein X769_15655 [Mesorhizobium sp. LSJC268A00]ESZ10772.1 hypothetical protein X735_27575 [Mesorhizobium sp. L2C085B000]
MATGLENEQKRPQRGLTGIAFALGFMTLGVVFACSSTLWVAREPGSRGQIIALLDRALTAAEKSQEMISLINAQNDSLINNITDISKKVSSLTVDDKQKQDILADLAATVSKVQELNKGPKEFLENHDLTFNAPAVPFTFISTAEAATTNKVKNPPAPPLTLLDQINDPSHRMLFVIMGALLVGGIFTILHAISGVPAKQKFYQTVIINVGTFLAGLGGGAFIAG